jgi:hypothetical protein
MRSLTWRESAGLWSLWFILTVAATWAGVGLVYLWDPFSYLLLGLNGSLYGYRLSLQSRYGIEGFLLFPVAWPTTTACADLGLLPYILALNPF